MQKISKPPKKFPNCTATLQGRIWSPDEASKEKNSQEPEKDAEESEKKTDEVAVEDKPKEDEKSAEVKAKEEEPMKKKCSP